MASANRMIAALVGWWHRTVLSWLGTRDGGLDRVSTHIPIHI
jgi:hypothetical protein